MHRTSKRATMTSVVVAVAALSGCGERGDAAGADVRTVAGEVAAPASADATADSGVTVVGVGTATAQPDVAFASVGVEADAEELSEAFERASQAAERVIDELRERGVAEQDIQTSNVVIRQRRPEPPPAPAPGPPESTGYVVATMLDVTIRDVDQVGEVLAGVAEAGGDATRVDGLRFGLEDDQAEQRQAREAAVEDARDKADQYAQLLGRELGEVVSVSEGGAGPVRPGGGVAAEAALPVEPGSTDVTVRVQATWELR